MTRITVLAIAIWLALVVLVALGGYKILVHFWPQEKIIIPPPNGNLCGTYDIQTGKIEYWRSRDDGEYYIEDAPSHQPQKPRL